jgi:GNAT superfamily N-acetyltransferase
MDLVWIRENPARWDDGKASVIGGAEPGALDPMERRPGEILPGEWWRVERAGHVVGYGWMDCTWGDAEILLAVSRGERGCGVGSFILDRLEQEAAARGLNYLYNQVRATHPDRDRVSAWLGRHGFRASGGNHLLRRQVNRRPS